MKDVKYEKVSGETLINVKILSKILSMILSILNTQSSLPQKAALIDQKKSHKLLMITTMPMKACSLPRVWAETVRKSDRVVMVKAATEQHYLCMTNMQNI